MRAARGFALVGAFVLLAGCTGAAEESESPDGPTASEESDVAQETTEGEGLPSGPVVTVTRQLLDIEIDVAVHAVEVEADVAALVVDYSPAEGDDFGEMVTDIGFVQMLSAAELQLDGQGIRLVDPQGGEVFPPITGDGDVAAEIDTSPNSPGYQSVSLHAAPETEEIDLLLPGLGYVAGIPVIEAGEGYELAREALDGDYQPLSYSVQTWAEDHEEVSSVEEDGEEISVTLTSDVLFGADTHDLGSEADAALEGVAQEIEAAADGGEVLVVGHTDSAPTTTYSSNDELSEMRAESVGNSLEQLLADDFDVRTEGRGESEPRASNSNSEGRAANRRVEIHFEGQRVEAAAEADDSAIPEPEGEVAGDGESIVIDGWEVAPESVERHGEILVGTLALSQAGEGDDERVDIQVMNPLPVHRGGHATRRGYADNTLVENGTTQVTILGSEGRVFPLGYETGTQDSDEADAAEQEAVTRLLAEERLAPRIDGPGQTRLITVLWPDRGQDSVTIDVAGNFRLTDVPVTE